MSNNRSLLITGATTEERLQAALTHAQSQSSQFDIIIIDAREEKGIAAVRTLIEKVATRPFQSPLTTVVLQEADNLTLEAQNALLKLLEEPPEHSQIILTTQAKNTLLPTVVSRCFEEEIVSTSLEEVNLNIDALFTSSLAERLETLEKVDLNAYLEAWHKYLKNEDSEKKVALKKIWNYTKLVVKLRKGSKTAVNKKLLALILALEFPVTL